MKFYETTKDEFKWWIEDGSGNRVGDREREREEGGVGWCMCENGYKKALKHKHLSSGQLCRPKAHLCGALQHLGSASS